jgi:hypothetical protein
VRCDFVDVIIALGMAKEGFDWIWCEHRADRRLSFQPYRNHPDHRPATRDAAGQDAARSPMIAEPAADDPLVVDAINDLEGDRGQPADGAEGAPLASPRRTPAPSRDFDYGPKLSAKGPRSASAQGQMHFEIKPQTANQHRGNHLPRGSQREASFVQDKSALERDVRHRGSSRGTDPTEDGQDHPRKVPELSEEDQEAVRQHAIAALTLTQQAKAAMVEDVVDGEFSGSTAFIDGVRKFALSVTDLDIDLIDRVNPSTRPMPCWPRRWMKRP